MSELTPPPLPPSALPDRPAAWWSWPVILLSVFFIGWSVNLFTPQVIEATSEADGSVDASELALFKIQSQIVIAAAPLSPKDAKSTLEELRTLAHSDVMILALAMVESFIGLEGLDPVGTLGDLSEEVSPGFRLLATKAVKMGVTPEEREELVEKLGWFGKLAPALDLEAPPEASQIRSRSVAFLGLASVLFVVVALGVIAGAILLLMQYRNASAGQAWGRFAPTAMPRGVMLESFALYLGIMALGDMGGMMIHPGFSYASYLLAVVVPFLWPFCRGIRWRDFCRSIGFHRGEGIAREIGAGFVGYLKVMAIASIGIFLTLILSASVGLFAAGNEIDGGGPGAAPVGPQPHPIVGWIYLGGVKERLLCLFLAAGFAPFFEELFFRGALHRWLRGRFGFLVSALLTGAIFAALHPQGWLGIPALAAMGVGFSLLRESRDSLIAPMVGHAINNGVLVVMFCLAL